MATRPNPRKDILVADGVDFYRHMLLDLLAGSGYHVTETDGAEETLAGLDKERPDLLLFDLNLPPRGGRSLLETIAASGRKPPRLVGISESFHDDAEIGQLRGLGVDVCVNRAAPMDDILVAVRGALFPDAKNLRRSPRAQVHVPVSYRVEEEDAVTNSIATHSFNLSGDGMFLVSTAVAPSAPGTRLELRFWLPAAEDVIQIDGVVIWSNQAGGRMNELYPPGMGVMFLGVGREEAGVINSYIRERTVNPFR